MISFTPHQISSWQELEAGNFVIGALDPGHSAVLRVGIIRKGMHRMRPDGRVDIDFDVLNEVWCGLYGPSLAQSTRQPYDNYGRAAWMPFAWENVAELKTYTLRFAIAQGIHNNRLTLTLMPSQTSALFVEKDSTAYAAARRAVNVLDSMGLPIEQERLCNTITRHLSQELESQGDQPKFLRVL